MLTSKINIQIKLKESLSITLLKSFKTFLSTFVINWMKFARQKNFPFGQTIFYS